MQNLIMVVVYDSKAEAYTTPFFSQTAETALREFKHTINNTKGPLALFSEDYSLFILGQFDQDEGTFKIHKSPIHLANAITLKTPTPGPEWGPGLEVDLEKATASTVTQLRDAIKVNTDV